ncbi:eukaryotic translation initiation factor 4E-1A-like isoform X2 [Littorina saxatilis]|uniref:EIF-4F 25 kDa subunit n=1 Tax=Littorina saxatilis TaxID=31220 RepID=A0AAN9BY64_9CAEN
MASSDTPKEVEDVEEEMALAGPEDLIKHPLQNRWAMWFFKNDKAKDWCDNLRVITTFSTVEDFWALYNHIQRASKLPSGCDYSVFKDGIQPMWEDEQNKRGGRWLVNMNKNQRHHDLDNVWQEMLLCLIGEAFEEQSDDVCGAVVNIRNKGDKLGIWTRDFNRQDSILKIGRTLRERMNMPKSCIMGYQAHVDAIAGGRAPLKNRFEM